MSSIWTLIYATNEAGSHLAGHLPFFEDAVLAGADVKVIYSPQEGGWWSRNLSSVNVKHRGGTILIAGTYMEAADTKPFPSGITFEQEPFALEYHIYNTTGIRFKMTFDYEKRRLISNESDIVSMRWYVKDYETKPWWFLNPEAVPIITGERANP